MPIHCNHATWEAIDQILSHYLEDERKDFEASDITNREGHIYAALTTMQKWAVSAQETEERGFNGWSNYETWAVALWMDNNEADYRQLRYLARRIYRDARIQHRKGQCDDPIVQTARIEIAKCLEHRVYEETIHSIQCLTMDLLNSSLDKIDWQELAESLLDEFAHQ
jgi:hypothetical protein